WQATQNVQLDYGELVSAAPVRALDGHQLQLRARFNNGPMPTQLSVGQMVLLPPGFTFIIDDIDSNVLLLTPLLFGAATEVSRVISGFVPQGPIGDIRGELIYNSATGILTSAEEDFSPEYAGQLVIDKDARGSVYQISAFIDACAVQVYPLCQLGQDVDAAPKKGVWQQLNPQYNNSIAVDGLTLDSVLIGDPSIGFTIKSNRLSLSYPEGGSASDILAQWQQFTLDRTLDAGRFTISADQLQSQQMSNRQLSLPTRDLWQKRYESLDPFGLGVSYQGRRDDKPAMTIKPLLARSASQFEIIDNELIISPGRAGATANTLASQWRLWCKDNDHQGFAVYSKDERLWPVEPVSELFMRQRDLQQKVALLTDAADNGISIGCHCARDIAASAVLQENLIDDYDFAIDENNQLIIFYPAKTLTLGATLVKAWQKWSADALNDPQNFDISLTGEDKLDILGQTSFDFASQYQLTLNSGINDNDQPLTFSWLGRGLTGDASLSIELADVSVAEFSQQPQGNIKVLLPDTVAITVDQLVSGWASWQQLNPTDALAHQLSLEGSGAATVNSGLYSLVKVAELGEVGDNGVKVNYTLAANISKKSAARVIFQKQFVSEPTSNYRFDYHSDELEDAAVLTVYFPTIVAHRTVEQLLHDWQQLEDNQSWGFALTMAGKGSWQVSAQTELKLTASAKKFYRLRTAAVPYLQIDYASESSGTPHLTMIAKDRVATDSDDFSIDVIETLGAPNLVIHFPHLAAHCQLGRLFDQWLALDQHSGFVLSDSSPRIQPRTSSPLTSTGNIVKQAVYNGLAFSYIGPDQDVLIDIGAHQPFNSDSADQQLLLGTGQLFTIKQTINAHEAEVEQAAVTALRHQSGLYPPAAVKTSAIRLQASVSAAFSPIAALKTADNGAVAKPALKMVLNPEFVQDHGTINQKNVFLYDIFRTVIIEQAKLTVEVSGISVAGARTDTGLVNTDAPFSLFGHLPEVDAGFEFSHPELCGKPLEQLSIDYQWSPVSDPDSGLALKLPDMALHYHHYSRIGDDNVADVSTLDYTTSLHYYNNKQWVGLHGGQTLFGTGQHYAVPGQQWPNKTALGQPAEADPARLATRYRLTLAHGVLRQDFLRLRTS
ncbi:MAG: hypothetical protein HRT35_34025, partial [Algicola sp.]|nr:hypothetical protein [Algicola sp.]